MNRVFERPVFARARRLCLGFPEAVELSSWDHPGFRAGQKTFCAFELVSGRPSIAFKASPADAALTLRCKDFFATPYGRGAWVSLWVDGRVDWTMVASKLDASYRLVANKRMLVALDSARLPKINSAPHQTR